MDINFVHEVLVRSGRQWKFDGKLREPTYEDVEEFVQGMFKDISEGDYDSIESGGILLKRDGDKIDLYVHLGEIDEDFSL